MDVRIVTLAAALNLPSPPEVHECEYFGLYPLLAAQIVTNNSMKDAEVELSELL